MSDGYYESAVYSLTNFPAEVCDIIADYTYDVKTHSDPWYTSAVMLLFIIGYPTSTMLLRSYYISWPWIWILSDPLLCLSTIGLLILRPKWPPTYALLGAAGIIILLAVIRQAWNLPQCFKPGGKDCDIGVIDVLCATFQFFADAAIVVGGGELIARKYRMRRSRIRLYRVIIGRQRYAPVPDD
jgi:hypothetical protein